MTDRTFDNGAVGLGDALSSDKVSLVNKIYLVDDELVSINEISDGVVIVVLQKGTVVGDKKEFLSVEPAGTILLSVLVGLVTGIQLATFFPEIAEFLSTVLTLLVGIV